MGGVGAVMTDETSERLAREGLLVKCWENRRVRVPGGGGNVHKAWWGDPKFAWRDGAGCGVWCNEQVSSHVDGIDAIVASNARIGCDPVPGVRKILLIELRSVVAAQDHVPLYPRLFETPDVVPSAPRWLAFVRHAEALHNVDGAFAQRANTPLTDAGVAQARAARSGLPGQTVQSADLVVTSPLMRALQTTAELVSETRVLVDATATKRWAAPCDGAPRKSEMLAELTQTYRDWEGWDTMPEEWAGHRGEDSWLRVDKFRAAVLERPEDRIVFVGHGGFWEMVLDRYLGNCEVVFCDRSFR